MSNSKVDATFHPGSRPIDWADGHPETVPVLPITDDLVDHLAHALHAGSWRECAFQDLHRQQARQVLDALRSWEKP